MNTPIDASKPLPYLQEAFAVHADSVPRQQAFARFLQQGWPTRRDEQWKYTDLRRFAARAFSTPTPGAVLAPASVPGHALIFVDGYYRAEYSQPTIPGVRIQPLAQSLPSDAEAIIVDPDLGNAFTYLNAALSEAVLIDIDADVVLQQPLWLQFLWSDISANTMAQPRILVRMQPRSRAVLVEHYAGSGAAAHLTNAVTTVQLAEGAQLEHCRVQQENLHSYHVGFLHGTLAAHAALVSHHFNLGAALARMDIDVKLRGAQAATTLNGLQFASGTQHHDTHTQVDHCLPHTQSREDYRGIADQRGRVVFNGKVLVHKHAAKTDAQQSSRNLLLASSAEIDTKPELEIYNDDVKCAHGATVGQLDRNALFYLRSRGLGEAQARAVLTHAFAEHLIAQVPVPILREQLSAASHARFDSVELAS